MYVRVHFLCRLSRHLVDFYSLLLLLLSLSLFLSEIMGKKQNKSNVTATNSTPPSVNTIQNRDIMQRMNFLWQASVYLESSGSGSGCEGSIKRRKVNRRKGEAEGRQGQREGEGRQGQTFQQEERQVEEEKEDTAKSRRKIGKMMIGSDLAKVYVQMMKCIGKRTTTGM